MVYARFHSMIRQITPTVWSISLRMAHADHVRLSYYHRISGHSAHIIFAIEIFILNLQYIVALDMTNCSLLGWYARSKRSHDFGPP